jgi:tRNA-(ms[2]io[6]A)-hydroxylase
VTLLCSTTDPRWSSVALADLDATLADHAHCEKKAAATALKLIADHPGDPRFVRSLSRLAQEELQHFLAVLNELGRRGAPLPPDRGDPYAQRLFREIRGGPGRLLDRLLVAALVEARSCERLGLLGAALQPGALRELYVRLAQAEAGHERLFLELASAHAGAAEARTRLETLARTEAQIVAGLPLGARIH